MLDVNTHIDWLKQPLKPDKQSARKSFILTIPCFNPSKNMQFSWMKSLCISLPCFKFKLNELYPAFLFFFKKLFWSEVKISYSKIKFMSFCECWFCLGFDVNSMCSQKTLYNDITFGIYMQFGFSVLCCVLLIHRQNGIIK